MFNVCFINLISIGIATVLVGCVVLACTAPASTPTCILFIGMCCFILLLQKGCRYEGESYFLRALNAISNKDAQYQESSNGIVLVDVYKIASKCDSTMDISMPVDTLPVATLVR